MSAPAANVEVEARMESLLTRVAEDRQQRSASLRVKAEAEARNILRAARSQARKNVHDSVARERIRIEQELRGAKARAEIEARRKEQQQGRTLLEAMWGALADALLRRWSEPALRRAWVAAALAQAGNLIPGRAWTIECGSGWVEYERAELAAMAKERRASAVGWTSNAAITAGLKIRAEGVCLDASVAGLLRRRGDIEAIFLSEYLRLLGQSSAPGSSGDAAGSSDPFHG